jgi:hypothetical protein
VFAAPGRTFDQRNLRSRRVPAVGEAAECGAGSFRSSLKAIRKTPEGQIVDYSIIPSSNRCTGGGVECDCSSLNSLSGAGGGCSRKFRILRPRNRIDGGLLELPFESVRRILPKLRPKGPKIVHVGLLAGSRGLLPEYGLVRDYWRRRPEGVVTEQRVTRCLPRFRQSVGRPASDETGEYIADRRAGGPSTLGRRAREARISDRRSRQRNAPSFFCDSFRFNELYALVSPKGPRLWGIIASSDVQPVPLRSAQRSANFP